jgi:CSLREA domain-containing protein
MTLRSFFRTSVVLGSLLAGMVITVPSAYAAPFTVDSSADPGDGVCLPTSCTLREAISLANTTAGADTIAFNIPGTGQHTIAPTSALPNITDPVTIDGFSDPDDADRIELDGTSAGEGAAGLTVFSGGSGTTIKGFVINDFGDEAIQLSTGGNTVQGNYMGTDETGLVAEGNFVGISIFGSGNQIGGTGAGQGNVISGNDNNGISLSGTNTVLEGNLIGPGSDGSADLGNGNQGLHIQSGAANNTVGGTTAAARNVISGNSAAGIFVGDPTNTGNVIRGNYIGTKGNGAEALPNNSGVRIGFGANTNTIGGTAAGAGNLISGNSSWGIQVFTSASPNSSDNTIQGNLIGTTSSGNAALGNGSDGINIFEAANTTIGGSAAGARNVISGNGGEGVEISGIGADSNTVAGNHIGLGSDGSTAISNGGNGVLLTATDFAGFATGNSIGGSGQGNVISGNGIDGIHIGGSRVENTTIQGNLIGLASDGSTDRGNVGDGIDSEFALGTTTIGGTTAAVRNLISGNGGLGMFLRSGAAYVVQGNFVGMDSAGTTAVPNSAGGAIVQGANSQIGGTAGVTVGGSCTGACNLISGNTGNGLSASSGSSVKGNYIGTDVTGLLDQGNSNSGIHSSTDSTTVTIGGTAANERNIISGNNGFGMGWGDVGANNDVIQGNYIGVGSDGTTAIGNSNTGMSVGGDGNVIGGPAAGAGNVIAFNGTSASPGIFVSATATGNSIRGNSIHSNGGLGIDIDPFGLVNANDAQDPDTGGNNRQNFPSLATAQVSSGAVTVTGTLNSVPSSPFTLDFYSSPSCNAAAPSNHGEGKTYLGATGTTTNASGDASFTFTSSGTPAVAAGDVITATATDAAGSTSEFSRCRVALATTSPTISIADTSVAEGDSGTATATFTVTLSAASTDTVTVDWATANGTATTPGDYLGDSGTVTFAPTDTTETIAVTVHGDSIDEGSGGETFQVNLSNAGGATIADAQAIGTITDDDDPTISIANATVPEGDAGTATASFTVTLSTSSPDTVTVDWATADGTATSPSDYQADDDTLTFTPGQTSKTIPVTVNGDTVDEENEAFQVSLSTPTNATIAGSEATGTITNDDDPCPGFESNQRRQVAGTAGPDTLIGTSAAEILCGLGGNDLVRGGGGKDLVLGGSGRDTLSGQAGNDLIKGQAGNDVMNGGPGTDRCVGGPGRDTARGCEKGRA